MKNYINGYCAYADPDEEVTAEDIEENRLLFTPDGEIFGEYRICSVCGDMMIDGYMLDEGFGYYCSDECLHKKYTHEEYVEMYENDDAYWTQWY